VLGVGDGVDVVEGVDAGVKGTAGILSVTILVVVLEKEEIIN
jgi:hypothetical protein